MESRNIEFIPKCLIIGLKCICNSIKDISGNELFQRFISTNNYCYWNINLKEILDKCELVGNIRPYCLLITAPDLCIQSLKLAHQKRLLKAPESFVIHYLGEVDPVHCAGITPSQFVSLDEALCYVIFDLNIRKEMSSFDIICCRLAEWYPDMQLPPQFLILATLRNLIDAGQIYYTGYGYNVMTTDKVCVAQWLGEQGIEDSASVIRPRSELSPEMPVRSRSDRADLQGGSLIRATQSSTTLRAPIESSVKRTKTLSAVKDFFAKLRSRHQKSQTCSAISPPHPTEDSVYESHRNYYQPRFYSSNIDVHPLGRSSTIDPAWISWRTSLQSLPAATATDGTLRRSQSSSSRLSTQAIPDQFSVTAKRHRTKPRHTHNKGSRQSCSKEDHVTTGDQDTVPEDSGVHSITESPYAKGDNIPFLDEDDTPPALRSQTRLRQRLSRSISTRLSSLTVTPTTSLRPVIEAGQYCDRTDDKRVLFKENVGIVS